MANADEYYEDVKVVVPPSSDKVQVLDKDGNVKAELTAGIGGFISSASPFNEWGITLIKFRPYSSERHKYIYKKWEEDKLRNFPSSSCGPVIYAEAEPFNDLGFALARTGSGEYEFLDHSDGVIEFSDNIGKEPTKVQRFKSVRAHNIYRGIYTVTFGVNRLIHRDMDDVIHTSESEIYIADVCSRHLISLHDIVLKAEHAGLLKP
ncbi:hypothetical protein FWF48_03130 [Candidatus Saccharibacteria bacterium]|nr:hypothetical protein [Candidatus Saccharibacteria bacterium]